VTALAFVVCGLAFLFVPSLTPLMLGRGEEVTQSELTKICQILLLLVPFQLGSLSGFYYLQILKRSSLYTTIQTAKLLFEVGLNFVLIGALDLGVYGFLLSMLVGEIVTSFALCSWILWTLSPRVDWRVLPPILLYAAPLIPVGLSQLALHNLDRRLLLEYSAAGTAQAITGVYGLGYKISYLVTTMMLGPFIQIWQPWIYGVQDERERASLVARVGTYAVLAVAAASLGVMLFGRQATILLAGDPAFWEAYRVIPFVTTGYVFWGLYHISQTPLFIAKRTGRLLVINLIAVAINVGLNVFLIPRHGIIGAAVSTLVTFAALACLGMLASRTEGGVVFEVARLGRILACVLLGGAFALWIDGLESSGRCEIWIALAGKALALPLLVASLWFGVLRPNERARFLAWIEARRGLARSG
jgi:O-antigen/teichoic acid export membrane protein